MKVLFIGGSGVISRASTRLAVERGIDLWLLNRGTRPPPTGTRAIVADVSDASSMRAALRGHTWDTVVQWIAFKPEDIERDIALFSGATRQYIFVSSASVYQKPPDDYLVTEKTPLANPFWEYSRQKIQCEQRLARARGESNFPGVVVRPSLTYGDEQVPLVLNTWNQSWTAIDRFRRGVPVVVPGDGSSLWTITHNTDFATGLVGLLGNPATIGESFHITSDEVLTWNHIFGLTARAAGVENPRLVHVPSEFIVSCLPALEGTLFGDKAVSVVFDNTKIKRFVPDFAARVSFAEGIRRTIAWFDANPQAKVVDAAANERWDRFIASYEEALAAARTKFLRNS